MKFKKHASLFLLALALVVPAFPQQKPDTPAPKPPPTPTPQPSREQPQAPQRERQQDFQRPVYVTGKVVLEDGTPLPNGVRVEMVYNGQVRRQDYTRLDGSFTFDLGSGSNSSNMADASIGSGDDPFSSRSQARFGGGAGMMGRVDLSGWEVRAVLPGYQSDVVVLQNRSALDNPDIGLVVLRPIGHVKATTVSLVSMKAPKKAKEAFEKAFKAVNKDKPDTDKAAKELQKAVEIYPEFAAAWDLLGQIKMEQKDVAGAKEAFQKAMAADADFISPYLALADIDIQEKKWSEAADLTTRLLELNPYVPRGQFLHAVAHYQLGKLDVAEESIRKLQSSNEGKNYTISHYVLGAILATKGNLPAAAGEFQLFLQKSPEHKYAVQVREQLSQWEKQGVVAQNQPAQPAAQPAASGQPAAQPAAKP